MTPALRQANGLSDRAQALPLRWGSDVAHLKPPFDVVLASDVAYDLECVPDLIATFASLCGPATRGYLAFEDRPGVPPARSPTEVAVASLPEAGLIATEVTPPPSTPQNSIFYTLRHKLGSLPAYCGDSGLIPCSMRVHCACRCR